MSEMIDSTNILLKIIISVWSAAKNIKKHKKQQKTAKKQPKTMFLFLLLKIWVCSIFFPQKHKFTSEMIASTNILLINYK